MTTRKKTFAQLCDYVAKHAKGVFRNGIRWDFAHEVYYWNCAAINVDGTLMTFSGDHGSSNPEHICAKDFTAEYSNGRFQGAVKTVSERCTTECINDGIHSRAAREHGRDIDYLLAHQDAFLAWFDAKVKETKAANKAADKAAVAADKALRKEFAKAIKFATVEEFADSLINRLVTAVSNPFTLNGYEAGTVLVANRKSEYGEEYSYWHPSLCFYNSHYVVDLVKGLLPKYPEVSRDRFKRAVIACVEDYLQHQKNPVSLICHKGLTVSGGRGVEPKFYLSSDVAELLTKQSIPEKYRDGYWRTKCRKATEQEIADPNNKFVLLVGETIMEQDMVCWEKGIYRTAVGDERVTSL